MLAENNGVFGRHQKGKGAHASMLEAVGTFILFGNGRKTHSRKQEEKKCGSL
jgi:hypothetical protein